MELEATKASNIGGMVTNANAAVGRAPRAIDLEAMIFEQGNREHNVYYIVKGSVNLIQDGRVIRSLKAHEYFGEMAVLNETPTIASAMSTSNESEIIAIQKVHLEMMLADEPKVAMKFLKKMSLRLQQR